MAKTTKLSRAQTEQRRARLRALFAAGKSIADIAAIEGMKTQLVATIVKRDSGNAEWRALSDRDRSDYRPRKTNLRIGPEDVFRSKN